MYMSTFYPQATKNTPENPKHAKNVLRKFLGSVLVLMPANERLPAH